MTLTSNIKKIGLSTLAVTLIAVAFFAVGAPRAQALDTLSTISSGDLIRGQSFSAVYYYGADGFRYVFPNQKVYDTWYSNFDNVKFLSDGDLGKIQIGGNVTYRPGIKMVKINTDPRTYAVARGGVLRHVGSEALAIELYGATWNKQIDDIPDGFFGNYTIGSVITNASDYTPAGVTSSTTNINLDKHLTAPAEISIGSSGYSPIDVTIPAGSAVRFTNNDSEKHSVTADMLDWGSGTLNTGDSFIRTFDEPGTYGFHDAYDGTNSGAVYVEEDIPKI